MSKLQIPDYRCVGDVFLNFNLIFIIRPRAPEIRKIWNRFTTIYKIALAPFLIKLL